MRYFLHPQPKEYQYPHHHDHHLHSLPRGDDDERPLEADEGDEDEGGDSSAIDCSFEGVSYTRDSKNVVFDDDFDEVGEWVDGAIVFDKFGLKSHKKALAQL